MFLFQVFLVICIQHTLHSELVTTTNILEEMYTSSIRGLDQPKFGQPSIFLHKSLKLQDYNAVSFHLKVILARLQHKGNLYSKHKITVSSSVICCKANGSWVFSTKSDEMLARRSGALTMWSNSASISSRPYRWSASWYRGADGVTGCVQPSWDRLRNLPHERSFY